MNSAVPTENRHEPAAAEKTSFEAALMAAGAPLSLERMQSLFGEENPPSFSELRAGAERTEARSAGPRY